MAGGGGGRADRFVLMLILAKETEMSKAILRLITRMEAEANWQGDIPDRFPFDGAGASKRRYIATS